MTVTELVRQLQQQPPDAEVYIALEGFMATVESITSETHWAYPEGPYIVVLRED